MAGKARRSTLPLRGDLAASGRRSLPRPSDRVRTRFLSEHANLVVRANARHDKATAAFSSGRRRQVQHDRCPVAACRDRCGPLTRAAPRILYPVLAAPQHASSNVLGSGCATANGNLFVHPNLFHPPIIVDAVDLLYDADHVRLPAGSVTIMHDNRPRSVLLQLSVDLPYQL